MKKTIRNRVLALLLIGALLASAILTLAPSVLAAEDQEVITISTAEEFAELARNCTLDTWSQGKKVVLQADISLTAAEFTTIPTFGGEFDGKGHTISGLNLTQSMSPSGLFGVLQEGAAVRDLKVSGSLLLSGDSGSVGGIVGENYGLVANCSFTGNVSGGNNVGGVAGTNAASGRIIACSASGSVVGEKMTGGIAGCNLGTIGQCRNSAYVNTVSVDPTLSPEDITLDFSLDVARLSSMDTGMTASDTGGIAGYSSGLVADCTNSAPVGYPHIGYNVGGIAGRSCGSVHACENSGDIFGRKDVGGIVGQMEPYIAQNISESTLSRLERQLDELDAMLTAALDDANAGVAAVASRLNKIADYLDSASGAASSIRTEGSITGAVTGGGEADGSGSAAVTPPQWEAGSSVEAAGGAGGGIFSGGELSADGEGSAGGQSTGTAGSVEAGVSAGAEGAAGAGSIAGGGVSAGSEVHAGLTEGGAEGESHVSADGGIDASAQLSLTTNLSGLSSAVSGMSGQMHLLSGEVAGTSGTLTGDMKAIQKQISDISDTVMDLYQYDSEGDILIDSSDLNLDQVTLGKVSSSRNGGSVNGDINVGGIAGAMAMEYELDPEDDITAALDGNQRRKLEVRAVIQDCVNTGSITAKRSYAGGICGRMDLGLIAGSEGYGSVSSESGNYVGGIAGSAASTVRHCFAKCTLSGEKYIGGIVGSGVAGDLSGEPSTVAGCYSMVSIASYREFAGAVSGADAGNFLENYFVSDTLTGINGRSYTGRAEPISYGELAQLSAAAHEPEEAPERPEAPAGEEEQESSQAAESTEEAEAPGGPEGMEDAVNAEPVTIPEAFLQLTLTFVADGESVKTVPFDYGASFDGTVYPDIPEKEGCYACWDRTELTELHFDTLVTAVYTPYVSALSDSEKRADGRPIFFIEGRFDDEAAPEITPLPNTPDDFDFLTTGWADYLVRSFSGRTVSREIVEQWRISIPDDGQRTHSVRYLPPDADPEHLDIYVKGENGWQKADSRVIGSYLVFPVEGTEAEIAAISVSQVWWVWLCGGFLFLLLLLLILRLVRKAVRARKLRAAMAVAASPETGGAAEGPAEAPAPSPSARKRRPWLTPLLVVLALLAGIGGTAAFFLLPDLLDDAKAYDLLKSCAEEQELAMELTVSGELDSRSFAFSASLDRTDVDGQRITVVSREGGTLYYCGGTVFLENGNAYKLNGSFPDYSRLLDLTMELYRYVDIQEKDGTYAITAEGGNAKAILELLMPSAAGLPADTNTVRVELLTDGDRVSRIRFTGDGTMDDREKTPFSLTAVLSLETEPRTRIPIPETVRSAVTGGEYEASEVLSGDLLRMVNAWLALERADSVSAKLLLKADCGPVTLDDSLAYYRWNDCGTGVSSVQKNGYALYFTDTAVCNQNGTLIPAGDAPSAEAAKLLDIACQACLNGSPECRESGGTYTYTLSLDADGMEAAAFAIAPAAEGMDISFDSGSIRVEIRDERLLSLAISCGGTVQVVLSRAEVSFEAEIDFMEDTELPEIPEAVRKALE